jgi:mRNA interferase MazF
VPITAWSERKAVIVTNLELSPTPENGLSKKSIADCLQTRPVDHRTRLVRIRGRVAREALEQIDQALKVIFALS